LLVPTEPEKGFALLLLPYFEPTVLPNLEMLSSLAHSLKPIFREEDCSPSSKSCKRSTEQNQGGYAPITRNFAHRQILILRITIIIRTFIGLESLKLLRRFQASAGLEKKCFAFGPITAAKARLPAQ
jgi:hypothetical protein